MKTWWGQWVISMVRVSVYGICATYSRDSFPEQERKMAGGSNGWRVRLYLMTARLSLSPTYVMTYKSGAQNSNSLSQLMMVDSGALTRNGPLQWPCHVAHVRANHQSTLPCNELIQHSTQHFNIDWATGSEYQFPAKGSLRSGCTNHI